MDIVWEAKPTPIAGVTEAASSFSGEPPASAKVFQGNAGKLYLVQGDVYHRGPQDPRNLDRILLRVELSLAIAPFPVSG